MKGIAMPIRMTGRMTLLSLLIAMALLFSVSTSFAGAPPKNTYGALTDTGATLQPDGSQQAIGTSAVTLTSGGGAVTTYTVTILGTSTVAAGEVTGVYVTDGTNTWSATGSYGPGNAVACTGANAVPVDASTLTISLTLAASSAGKQVGVELTSEDSGVSQGLPTAGSLHNIYAPADTLSVTANTPVASSASPGDLDVQMQYLQLDSDAVGDGQVEITTVTVDDLGTAGAGDIDNLKVHIDDNTNFGDGVLGTATMATWDGTSTAVDMTAIGVAARTVASGTSKYIWITYDVNAATVDGTTIQSSVTSVAVAASDTGATGTWNSNSITIAAGLANSLTSCADCHDYPPADGSARNNPEGAVIGDHTVHNAYTCNFCHVIPASETSSDFAHRDGDINMKAATIGDAASGDNGTYSRGATFAQSNSPTTGTCSNVDCHSNNVTPQWGVGTTDCTSCHSAPPATGAHDAHYAAKGWTSPDTAGANCATCHPGDHDGVVEVNAGLTYAGGGGSCSSPGGLGCHNDYTTPNWSGGTASCTSCHTAGGANTADPVSGLHDETPTVSAVIHNPSDANFAGCEDCHTTSPSTTHYDGAFDAPDTFDAGIGYAAGSPATCTASTCHSDGGAWSRKWHENSDLSDGSECAGCHGDWVRGWNTGVTHRTDAQPRTTHGTGTTYECKDCHALEAATGYTYTSGTTDWGTEGSNHGDGNITINSNGTSFARGTGGSSGLSGCSACHNAFDGTASGQHSFTTTSWTLAQVSGDVIEAGCDSCHGGSGNYYPTGSAYPNRAGRHIKHLTDLATAIGYGAGPWTDAQQKHMCEYCHNDANGVGGSGHTTDSGDSIADVGDFNPIWDTANPPATVDDGTFNTTDQTCATTDCHNNKTTSAGTYGWRDGGTSSCTMCHIGGTNDPTSGLHTGTPTVSGTTHDNTLDATGCEVCHTGSPSSSHISGTFETSAPTIAFAAGVGFTDGSPPTCTASTCHSDGGAWNRQWHANATATDGTECAGCHGTFTTGFVTGMSLRHQTSADGDTGGEIEANHDGTDKCLTCHAYDGADTYGYKWATHHRDNSIEISDQVSFVDNGTTVGCDACHGSADGTADGGHEFTDTTATNGWTRTTVAGPTAGCTSCHSAAGTGAAGVGPDSPHSNDTAAGGGVYTCEGCHTSHSGGTVVVPNNADVGINYTGNGETGINLGGSQTTGTTEAEICWNCHDTNAVSEWGINAGGSYDYGSVDVSNWSVAVWSSANFTYKDGSLTTPPGGQTRSSMHDTLSSPWPATTTDSVSDVSCTYCHDVHDTNTAPGDASSGKPYLRGTWNPSPYPEDGAPRSTDTYTAGASPYGAVPRGNTGTTGPGAYQIDQNNADPNAGMGTYAATDGLCQLCHDEATLVTNAPLHSNPVGYFTNDTSAARNIFKQSDRQAALTRFDPGMAYQNTDPGTYGDAKGWMGGLRNSDFDTGIAVPPTIGGRYGYDAPTFEWGVTMDDATVDVDFHNFSCSKCHTPHASRLPRLMITNCLDTSVNTWDDQYVGNANWSNWPGVTPGDNHELAEAHTAQNCHRDTGEASGPGWNTVTPW